MQALNEIVELLSVYSSSNTTEDYVALLDGVGYVVLKLKEELWRKQQHRKQKNKKAQSNRTAANAPWQGLPNVATMSLADLPSSTLRSHLKPGLVASADAEHPSDSNLRLDMIGRPSGPDRRSEATTIDCESSTPKTDAGLAKEDVGAATRDKLKQEIEHCKNYYRGKNFVVHSDERSETVYPNEINRFFSHFQEGEWLTNFNVMPLIFSFGWPATTLVLHSSYTSFAASKNTNQQSTPRVRWPLGSNHDRVILPCCFQNHWTLFDVDLKRSFIRQYDSLAGDVAKSAEVVSAIKERLTNAMEGWQSQKQDFATGNGVSEDAHSFPFLFVTADGRRHLNSKGTILTVEFTWYTMQIVSPPIETPWGSR